MYHKIDGVTVAIGVMDILDTYISSQYLLWDPKYAFLGLGKVSVIREIEYMKMLKKSGAFPNLKYYLLGDYMPSNSRLNYKSLFKPAEVCCPHTKRFLPLTPEVITRMESYHPLTQATKGIVKIDLEPKTKESTLTKE